MEALLIVFALVRMLTNAAEDLHNAAKGRPRRPRLADRLSKWNSSAGNRYGARRYLADLWQDAWKDARAGRDAKRAKRDADRAGAAKDAAKQSAVQPGPVPGAAAGERPARKPSPRPRPDPPQQPQHQQQPGGVAGVTLGPDQLAEYTLDGDDGPLPWQVSGPQQPKLRLVADPAASPTPDPALAPAGDNPTPVQPAGKDDPMSTSGEITSAPKARAFAEAMIKHNKEVLTEIEHAGATLSGHGVSGRMLKELNSVRECYAQADARWAGLIEAVAQHESLAEAIHLVDGAARDLEFYTRG